MAPSLPKPQAPTIPVANQQMIYENVGKYARGAVLHAFQQIGGTEALAAWAVENPTDFYTKLFPKIIARETESREPGPDDSRVIEHVMRTVVDPQDSIADATDDGQWEP